MTDATTPINAEPTADELASAQAVFDRMQAALTAKCAALAPKMKELTDADGFETILTKATALRDEIGSGQPFHDHLNAMVVGMTNAKTDVAAVPVA